MRSSRKGGKAPVEISRRLINLFAIGPQRAVSHCPAPTSHRVVGLVPTTIEQNRQPPEETLGPHPQVKEQTGCNNSRNDFQ